MNNILKPRPKKDIKNDIENSEEEIMKKLLNYIKLDSVEDVKRIGNNDFMSIEEDLDVLLEYTIGQGSLNVFKYLEDNYEIPDSIESMSNIQYVLYNLLSLRSKTGILKYFIESGKLDPHFNGDVLIIYACMLDRIDALKYLLQFNPNMKMVKESCLGIAVTERSINVVKFMMENELFTQTSLKTSIEYIVKYTNENLFSEQGEKTYSTILKYLKVKLHESYIISEDE